MKPEQERLITVLKDTISLLCKSSLTYEEQVVVQGLICITVDKQDVVVVPVHDSVGQAEYEPCVACGNAAKEAPEDQQNRASARKRKRRRRSSAESNASSAALGGGGGGEDDVDEDEGQESRVKIKKEEPDDVSDDEDLILIDEDIKREHCNDNDSFITGYMHNSQLSSITAAP